MAKFEGNREAMILVDLDLDAVRRLRSSGDARMSDRFYLRDRRPDLYARHTSELDATRHPVSCRGDVTR